MLCRGGGDEANPPAPWRPAASLPVLARVGAAACLHAGFRGERLPRGNPARGDGTRLEIPVGVQRGQKGAGFTWGWRGLQRWVTPAPCLAGVTQGPRGAWEWGHPSSACTHPQGPAGVLFFQRKVSALGRGWRGGPRSCWPLAKGKGLLVALPPFVRASHPPSAPHGAGRVGEALERVRKPSPRPRRRYMPPSVHPRVSPCPFPAG